MKYNILTTIAVVGAAWALSSCDDTWSPNTDTSGSLLLSSLDVAVSESSRSSDVDVDEFLVEVIQNDEVVAGPYAYGEMPEVVTLPTGSYTIQVESHEQDKSAWEAPYYLGSKSFTVEADKISSIGTVTCYFSNVKVTITYDDDLYEVMGSDCKVVVVANDDGYLTFAKDETRSGYFQAIDNSMTLVATFSGTVDGNSQSSVLTYTDVCAGQHYQINYSLKTGNTEIPSQGATTLGESGTIDTNSSSSSISIDVLASVAITDTVDTSYDVSSSETVIDVTRPTEDEDNSGTSGGTTTQDPTTTTTTLFTVTGTFDVDAVNEAVSGTWIAYLHSENPLAHLYVVIDSTTLSASDLEAVGLAGSFDLAYPGSLESNLSGMGFPVSNEVIGATDLDFDISGFIPLLTALGSGTSNFILTMVDDEGNEYTHTLYFIVY